LAFLLLAAKKKKKKIGKILAFIIQLVFMKHNMISDFIIMNSSL